MTVEPKTPFVTLDPTSGPLRERDPRSIAERQPTLDGASLALLSNGKSNGSELLDAVFDELALQFELSGAMRFKKGSVSVPPLKEDFAQMAAQATAVVTAIGD